MAIQEVVRNSCEEKAEWMKDCLGVSHSIPVLYKRVAGVQELSIRIWHLSLVLHLKV
jgi:hypothetical protein